MNIFKQTHGFLNHDQRKPKILCEIIVFLEINIGVVKASGVGPKIKELNC